MSTLIQTTLHAQRAQASSKGVMVVPPPWSGLWAYGQAKGCPSGAPATRMSTAPTGALGWTPAGTVCWDGDGPGWSGGVACNVASEEGAHGAEPRPLDCHLRSG